MKVSVIIPAYNAEKYLGVCLESILIQTLQDFEVIVVDDCSTDNSATVAENYLERFGGRLKIITLPENTGGGGIPRNIGFEYAQGKYIFFADADDLIVDTALETFYNFAEEYQTDVVSTAMGFVCDEEPLPKNFREVRWSWNPKEIYFDIENFKERLEIFFRSQYEWVPWSRFLRRDFLINNAIIFPDMKFSEDVIWNLKIIFTAKRWLRIDMPLYFQRIAPNSITRQKRKPEQTIISRTSPLINGVECLDEFMRGREYFKKNPDIRHQILKFFVKLNMNRMEDAMNDLPQHEVYEIFLREFSKAGSTQPALISYLLVMNNMYRNELSK